MAFDDWSAFNPQPLPTAPKAGGLKITPLPDRTPKTSYRTLSAKEAADRGLPAGGVYQISSEGNISTAASPKEATGKDFKPTEFQSKSAGFLGRMVRADRAWGGIGDDDKGPRGIVRQWMHEELPNIENTMLNSNQRQAADQNVNDFIAASLRQESGAAISPVEFDRQFRIFFPMPGDGPDVLKQKIAARKQAIEGFRVAAGPLGESVLLEMEKAQEQAGQDATTPLPKGTTGDIGFNTPPEPSNPLNPDQQAAYDAFWKANPKASADQLRAFGATINVDIPNADDIIKARDAGAGVIGGAGAVSGLTPDEQAEVDRRVKGAGTLKRIGAGTADTLTMGASNKMIAAGRDLTGKGEYDRELLKANAVTDQIADESPWLYHGGQVGGALALPNFGAKSINQLGRLGASYGAAYGVGSSDRLADVPENLLTGGAAGYALGAGIPAAGNFLGKLKGGNPEGREVYEAARRLGMFDDSGNVSMMPADVGGTMTRKLTAGAAQGPVSAIPVIRQARNVTEAAQGARDRIAAGVGNAGEPEAAGQAAARGSQKFIARTSGRGDQLYKRAEALAGNAQVPMPKAIAAVDQHIGELGQSPTGGAGLDMLQSLRGQLEGNFTVKGIRMMRTDLRDEFAKQGLRGSDLERRVNDVVNAAAEDIADGLASQGKSNAAGVYRLADRYWRARIETIDKVLQPIIGRQGEKSGEEVMRAVNNAAVGNNERLAGLLKALPAEDQATVRATLISQLGRASKGNQNAEGSAFSLSEFLTHWNAISPGAKRTLFQGETRAALDDLAKVAEGTKQAQRHSNFSNTAGGVTAQLLIAGVPYSAGGLFGTAMALAGQYGAGKMLASPRFARWLVGASKARNPAQHIGLLDGISAKEAPIAAELTGLKQALLNAVNDNVTPAVAASEPNQGRRND